MQPFATIDCPHCGEKFTLAIDPSEDDAEFVIDCEICCRPMAITVHDGEVHAVAD